MWEVSRINNCDIIFRPSIFEFSIPLCNKYSLWCVLQHIRGVAMFLSVVCQSVLYFVALISSCEQINLTCTRPTHTVDSSNSAFYHINGVNKLTECSSLACAYWSLFYIATLKYIACSISHMVYSK